jgi:hypothetical protein
MAMTFEGASDHDGNGSEASGGMQVNFHIGDGVRVGTRIGTITDVGTVLIRVRSDEGRLRVVCPWELSRDPRPT